MRQTGNLVRHRNPRAPSSRALLPAVEHLERRQLLSAAEQQSAAAGVDDLRRVMDQYHDRFAVYDDVGSPGNHFHGWAKIGDDPGSVAISGASTLTTHSGATAIRAAFRNTTGRNFAGFYFLNGTLPAGATAPQLNFGTVPDAGVDLRGARTLTFWARGERGGERIEFFMGGVGRDPVSGAPQNPFPDSTPVVKVSAQLTQQWQQYRIALSGKDLRYVLGGFGWIASAADNPDGAVFNLDDIQYELDPTTLRKRLDEPRLLRSFETLPIQPHPFDSNPDDDFDFVLRNLAFTYDNALAALAFLAEGTADGLRRARLIGDALAYASAHDRTFVDGRLRSAYAAGDIALPPGWTPNDRAGTVPIPGFYDEPTDRFYEVEQGATDVGNNAWAMIALLALYSRTRAQVYLDTARRLGEFIRGFRNDSGTYPGFLGGIEGPEGPAPSRRPWSSAEHNLDVFAAFTAMAQITGEPRWREDAALALNFVESMWDAARGSYLTGTIDPDTRNMTPGQLPLDVQTWSVLSLPETLSRHPEVLASAEQHHRVIADGFSGADFNEDRDGVWFEGTAQLAVAYAFARRDSERGGLSQELRRAQQSPPTGNGGGISAASHDGLSTGFGFRYFRRLHVGATAWNVFAQLGFNPYYQTLAQPRVPAVLEIRPTSTRRGFTGLVLIFSDDLDASRAQNLANYQVSLPGRKTIGRGVRLRSATYDSPARSVTLKFARALGPRQPVGVTVNGDPPQGLVDITGTFLDGDVDGHPGGDYIAKVRVTAPRPPKR